MILNVAFLDVSHGDCAAVIFDEPDRKACIVVDGGEDTKAARILSGYLKTAGVEVIDLLVGTHMDSDHIGGLIYFLKGQSIKASHWNRGKEKCIKYFWGPEPDPKWVEPKLKKEHQTLDFVIQSIAQNHELHSLVEKHIFDIANIHYPSLQEPPPAIFHNIRLDLMAPDIQVPDSEIQAKALNVTNLPYKQALSRKEVVVSPEPLKLNDLRKILAMNTEEMAKNADRDANNQSIVFKLTPLAGGKASSKKWTFLFAGDAEKESWAMMRRMAEVRTKLPSRVLKVPHHGSINGIDEMSLDAILPTYNIISAGQKHGLPDGQTLNLIRSTGRSKIFCTERNNSREHPGACRGKIDCPRGAPADFSSIRFVIDTDTAEEKIELFDINPNNGKIKIKSGQAWCAETSWN
jgi:beta-lactamase superfamily II metal-dependent hydrolase